MWPENSGSPVRPPGTATLRTSRGRQVRPEPRPLFCSSAPSSRPAPPGASPRQPACRGEGSFILNADERQATSLPGAPSYQLQGRSNSKALPRLPIITLWPAISLPASSLSSRSTRNLNGTAGEPPRQNRQYDFKAAAPHTGERRGLSYLAFAVTPSPPCQAHLPQTCR